MKPLSRTDNPDIPDFMRSEFVIYRRGLAIPWPEGEPLEGAPVVAESYHGRNGGENVGEPLWYTVFDPFFWITWRGKPICGTARRSALHTRDLPQYPLAQPRYRAWAEQLHAPTEATAKGHILQVCVNRFGEREGPLVCKKAIVAWVRRVRFSGGDS